MSLEFLSAGTRSTLEEVARMAYGSGWREGARGGKGRIGLLTEDGRTRVIKYNTHVLDRGPFGEAKSQAMIDSSARLRNFLWDVANRAGLRNDVLASIREQLGVSLENRPVTSLLSRKVVADVLQKIGGDQIWADALGRGTDIRAYSSKKLTTSFSKVVETGAAADTAASKAVQGMVSMAGWNAVVAEERDKLRDFCLRKGLNSDRQFVEDLMDAHGQLLNARVVEMDVVGHVTEQDVRSGAIRATARLLRFMAAARGLELSYAYLSDRKDGLGVSQKDVGDVHQELIEDHDGFFKTLEAKRLGNEELYGKVFVLNFLRELLANDLRPQPVDVAAAERLLSRWEAIKTEDLPHGGAPIDRVALLKALSSHCGNESNALAEMFGGELQLKHLVKLGVTRQELRQIVYDSIENHRFQNCPAAPGIYFRMVAKWLVHELEKQNLGDPAALRESILQRLRDCAPLCAVNGTEPLRKDKLLADLQRELEHPVYAGKVKNLTGSIELGGEIIPLWTKVSRYVDIYGEKTGCEDNFDKEHELMKEVIAGRLLKFCDDDENDPRYLTLLKCCTDAGRSVFGLFCADGSEENLACHREFWKEGDKIHFRISANVDGATCAAHYEIGADGQMKLLRIPMDQEFPSVSQAADEPAQPVDQQMADELEQVRQRIQKMEFDMAEIEGEVEAVTEEDLNMLSNPFVQKEPEPLLSKEKCAAEIVSQSDSQPMHAMLCYNAIRVVGKENPNVAGHEAELLEVQRNFESWLEEKKNEGKIQRQDSYWAWFRFGEEVRGNERPQQAGESSFKSHKLYLTVPNNRIGQMKHEDFEAIYKALNDLSSSFSKPCTFKLSKVVYSGRDAEDWLHSTDQLCGYFDSEEDLKLAEQALKDLNKGRDDDYVIEHGTDVEIGSPHGVYGRSIDGKQQCLSVISHTGIISLRAWVVSCIRTGMIPRNLRTEFNAAKRFLLKFDAGTLNRDDRLLVAYLQRFLFVRYGLPVKLVAGAPKPTPHFVPRGVVV